MEKNQEVKDKSEFIDKENGTLNMYEAEHDSFEQEDITYEEVETWVLY